MDSYLTTMIQSNGRDILDTFPLTIKSIQGLQKQMTWNHNSVFAIVTLEPSLHQNSLSHIGQKVSGWYHSIFNLLEKY